MEHTSADPALTVAFAMAAGILAQSAARHLKLPGIVLLLAAGVLLGPDLAGVIRPDSLGDGLHMLVGFAVAVILFEGGMNLRLRRIRSEGRAIRQLITVGALVTAVGGTLAARLGLGWDWRLSILFGTLVIVTGPTVVTPLLRRLRIQWSVATVLEAEGVLIDAIGAIIAVVAVEVAIHPTGLGVARGALEVVGRLGFGVVFGVGGGVLLALLLRVRNVVPEGLENVFVLSLVFTVFQGANAVVEESGIAAATVAGLVVGNSASPVQRELHEFKEQLTVLLVGMLFILLAADVRLADVAALGSGGALVLAALVLVVRPLNVIAGTWGSDLDLRQRALIAWISPRGIVAAAVASIFAVQLEHHGVPGGEQLRALVFLVIAGTVLIAGLTGGGVARLLGLRRATDSGWVILGGNAVGRALATTLRDAGEEVVCIDANPGACQAAQDLGLRVVFGNAFEERTLHQAEIETRAGVVGVTPNEEVNLLFAERARKEGKVRRAYVALKDDSEGVTAEMVHALGGRVLFGRRRDVELWSVRLRRGKALLVRCSQARELQDDAAAAAALQDPAADALVIPLVVHRGGGTQPADDATRIRRGDSVTFVVNGERRTDADDWLDQHGWVAEAAADAQS